MVKICNISLNNFRNFTQISLPINKNLVVFSGSNGSGKTSILESITLFGRSQTIRGDDPKLMINQSKKNLNQNLFSASLKLQTIPSLFWQYISSI